MKSYPSKVVFIRHAESERNKTLNGALYATDPTLFESIAKVPDQQISITEYGVQQAAATAEPLKNLIGIPDIVYHSGYQRTKQTTEGVLKAYGDAPIQIKENLAIREREAGYTHILLEQQTKEYFPYLQDYWDVVGGLFARPVGGESLIDVIEKRLRPFVEKVFEMYRGKTVVFVTHGRVIQCLRFILDDMTWEEMELFLKDKENNPKNCGVTVYSYDAEKDKLKLDMYNETFYKEEIPEIL
ncbi:MAG: hypothetical protein RL094_807 [Candidatus Parcubacteria bacterium]|jgi:broad specificity phosphatase PhoE